MNKLDKSKIGLGEVRNRLNPSVEEIEALNMRVSRLLMDSTIEGFLSNFDNHDKVTRLSRNLVINSSGIQDILTPEEIGKTFVLDLENVKYVRVSVDVDDHRFILVGGPQAQSIFFEFTNYGEFDIDWFNLRVPYGIAPGLNPTPVQPVDSSGYTTFGFTPPSTELEGDGNGGIIFPPIGPETPGGGNDSGESGDHETPNEPGGGNESGDPETPGGDSGSSGNPGPGTDDELPDNDNTGNPIGPGDGSHGGGLQPLRRQKTILEIVRLGNEYYLIGELHTRQENE